MLLMAILPALLVSISALLSYAYRFSKTIQLSDRDRKLITTAHAFAIETLQLLLLLSGILTMIIFCDILTDDRYEMSVVQIQVPFCFALVFTLGIYIAAIVAIDLVDNRIQLGTWKHPFQSQTFLLTRSKFLPWTVKRRFAASRTTPRRHIRQRAFSSPASLNTTAMRKVMMSEESRCAARSLSVVDTGAEPTTNVVWSRSLSTTFSPTSDSKALIAQTERPASEKARLSEVEPSNIDTVIAEKEESSAQFRRNEDIKKWRDEVSQAHAVKSATPVKPSSASTPNMLTPPSTPPPRILRAL